jgi:hypothetical protein
MTNIGVQRAPRVQIPQRHDAAACATQCAAVADEMHGDGKARPGVRHHGRKDRVRYRARRPVRLVDRKRSMNHTLAA